MDREQLASQLRSIKSGIEQLISDKESWNDNQAGDGECFDVGAEKSALFYADQALNSINNGDMVEAEKWSERLSEAARAWET